MNEDKWCQLILCLIIIFVFIKIFYDECNYVEPSTPELEDCGCGCGGANKEVSWTYRGLEF